MMDAIRQIGVSEVTYYRWRHEFGGLKIEQVKRLKDIRSRLYGCSSHTNYKRCEDQHRSSTLQSAVGKARAKAMVTFVVKSAFPVNLSPRGLTPHA